MPAFHLYAILRTLDKEYHFSQLSLPKLRGLHSVSAAGLAIQNLRRHYSFSSSPSVVSTSPPTRLATSVMHSVTSSLTLANAPGSSNKSSACSVVSFCFPTARTPMANISPISYRPIGILPLANSSAPTLFFFNHVAKTRIPILNV